MTAVRQNVQVDAYNLVLPRQLPNMTGALSLASYGGKGDALSKDNGSITSGGTTITGTFQPGGLTDVNKLFAGIGMGPILQSGTTTASITSGVTANILQDTSATFTQSMVGARLFLRSVGVAGADIRLIVWDVIDTHNIHFSRCEQDGGPSNPITTTIASGTSYAIAGNLYTTIVSSTATTAVLADAAGNSITNARYIYGTNNASAFAGLLAAVPTSALSGGAAYGAECYIPHGWYLTSSEADFTGAGLRLVGGGAQGFSQLLAKGGAIITPVGSPPRKYLNCTGVVNQGYSTPSISALNLTTSVDLRAFIQPTTWTGSTQWLVGKGVATSTGRSYVMNIGSGGSIQFQFSTTGASWTAVDGPVMTTTSPIWVRANASYAAGTTSVSFYTSPDGVNWAQVGPVKTASGGPWFASSTVAEAAGSGGPFNGKLFAAQICNSSGTALASFDAHNLTTGSNYTDPQGLVWTHESVSSIATAAYSPPPIPFVFGLSTSNNNGGTSLELLHILVPFYDATAGMKTTDMNDGRVRDVTISGLRNGKAWIVDKGAGNTQYWDVEGLNVVGCLRGIEGPTGIGSSGWTITGGVFDGMENALNIYPQLGSCGIYGLTHNASGVKMQGLYRLVDSGPVFGGSHSPTIQHKNTRCEHFVDYAFWLEGYGSRVEGGSFASSNSGGTAATGIHIPAGTLGCYLSPGYSIPTNITMYSSDTVSGIRDGSITVDDPQNYPTRVQVASRDLSARVYGCKLDGTDDSAALNAALAAAATAGCGVLLDGIATVMSGVEILTVAPLRGAMPRVCGIKAGASFSGSQLVRNWTTADWSGGETNHRVAPTNPVLSGTHTLNHYPVVENIDLDPGANTNLALLSWVAPQETGWINAVTMHGGSLTEASKGTWGLDLQAGSVAGSGLNGARVGQLTLYQYGWDRQISIDGQAGGGGDIHLQEVIQSPGKSYDASVWVRNCGGIAFGRLCLNSPADSGSHAQIYLVNVFGDFVVDKLYVQASATPSARPLILTADTTGGSTSVGSRRSAPVIREANFFPTGGGPYYPNGFITDMYNTVPYDSGTIGSDTVNLFTQMSYDGYEIKATNTDGTRVRHNYKAVT